MKINQYCSVCKQHLDMEVIPTDDAGDDGVIWLRCPQCHGFLPKFSGEGRTAPAAPAAGPVGDDAAADEEPLAPNRAARSAVDRPVEDGSRIDAQGVEPGLVDGESIESSDRRGVGTRGRELTAGDVETGIPAEPVAEYAAALAAADLSRARPYRATDTFAVGDVIHHLAYGDVGIVVAKEKLPGGRLAVKAYFEEAGVVHLIEQSPVDSR